MPLWSREELPNANTYIWFGVCPKEVLLHRYIWCESSLGQTPNPSMQIPVTACPFRPLRVTLVLCRGSETSSSAGSWSWAVTMEAGANLGREVTRFAGWEELLLSTTQNHPRGVMLSLHRAFHSWKAWGMSVHTSVPAKNSSGYRVMGSSWLGELAFSFFSNTALSWGLADRAITLSQPACFPLVFFPPQVSAYAAPFFSINFSCPPQHLCTG